MSTTKHFPNGFSSWQETHYEVVAHLTMTTDYPGTAANTAMTEGGTGKLYELAEHITDEFENKYSGHEWDGEFFDVLSDYLEKNY